MVKFFVWSAFNGYVIQNLYKPHIIPGKRIQTFRMFIDELSCVITWWGRVVERWCRCQDAHLQETKHGTKHPLSLTTASGRSNSKQLLQMCCVFRKVQAVQKSESGGQRQRPQSALKLFTGANSVKCFCALLPAMKTVSNYITRK